MQEEEADNVVETAIKFVAVERNGKDAGATSEEEPKPTVEPEKEQSSTDNI